MLDMIMWMNKRRLLLTLLIAAIVFMVFYALLYPKTVFTLVMNHEDGTRMIYRMNTRGTVHILDYAGPSDRDGSVRLSQTDTARAKELARVAIAQGSVETPAGDAAYSLTVGGVTVSGDALSPAAAELWRWLEPYVR